MHLIILLEKTWNIRKKIHIYLFFEVEPLKFKGMEHYINIQFTIL